MNKNNRIIAISVLILAIIVMVVYCFNFKSSIVTSGATIEGYVKQVCLDDGKILICYDFKNISNKEYMGDCYIPVEEDTVISDGRTLDSVKQGDYIIVTYTGTLSEIYPTEIDGTVLIQLVK